MCVCLCVYARVCLQRWVPAVGVERRLAHFPLASSTLTIIGSLIHHHLSKFSMLLCSPSSPLVTFRTHHCLLADLPLTPPHTLHGGERDSPWICFLHPLVGVSVCLSPSLSYAYDKNIFFYRLFSSVLTYVMLIKLLLCNDIIHNKLNIGFISLSTPIAFLMLVLVAGCK